MEGCSTASDLQLQNTCLHSCMVDEYHAWGPAFESTLNSSIVSYRSASGGEKRTCSTTNTVYWIICRCSIGWRLASRMRRCRWRSRNGMMTATRWRAIHDWGVQLPPRLSLVCCRSSSANSGASNVTFSRPTNSQYTPLTAHTMYNKYKHKRTRSQAVAG